MIRVWRILAVGNTLIARVNPFRWFIDQESKIRDNVLQIMVA